MGGRNIVGPRLNGENCIKQVNTKGADHLGGTAVKTLMELVTQVKDEQSYIVMRERTHRNTAESTNGRVKWWSIFQLGVLIGEGIFQVWWLKRFFEVSLRSYTESEERKVGGQMQY